MNVPGFPRPIARLGPEDSGLAHRDGLTASTMSLNASRNCPPNFRPLPVTFQKVRTRVGRVIVGQRDPSTGFLWGSWRGGISFLKDFRTGQDCERQRPGPCDPLPVFANPVHPDLLPGDITGTLIYDPVKGTYSDPAGPIFANLVPGGRNQPRPSKVQSALLEAMQERQTTIGDKTWHFRNRSSCWRLRTDRAGGHLPAPEAQMDRFMLKVIVGYPSAEEELVILDRMASTRPPF